MGGDQTDSDLLHILHHSMHNLPVEVVSEIFREACFDDQATGRSLALTSKWINDVVQPVRFEATSLYGPSQIIQFASMLDGLPLGTLKIRHLFISGISTKRAEEERVANNTHLRKLAAALNLTTATDADCIEVERCGDIYNEKSERHLQFLNKVLQHVSPSIHTLFLINIASGPVSPVYPFMPNLTDLSCGSAYYLWRGFVEHVSPRLRRIHTNASFYGYGFHREQVDFRIYAPMLEEVRVERIGRQSFPFVQDVVAWARDGTQGIGSKLLFPKGMKRVFIQQTPPPYQSWGTNSYLIHDESTTYLSQAANEVAEIAQRQGGFRLVLLQKLDISLWLQGKIDGLSYTFHDARRDWRDVIFGGKGAWDDSYAITDLP